MNITWHIIGKGKKLHANPNLGNLQYAMCHRGPLYELRYLAHILPGQKCFNCIREIVKLKEKEKSGFESWAEGHPESPEPKLIGGYHRKI